jgi:hypothetical protein
LLARSGREREEGGPAALRWLELGSGRCTHQPQLPDPIRPPSPSPCALQLQPQAERQVSGARVTSSQCCMLCVWDSSWARSVYFGLFHFLWAGDERQLLALARFGRSMVSELIRRPVDNCCCPCMHAQLIGRWFGPMLAAGNNISGVTCLPLIVCVSVCLSVSVRLAPLPYCKLRFDQVIGSGGFIR